MSNRLPALPPGGGPLQAAAGGLASAVLAALRQVPESLWLGWNGRLQPARRARRVTQVHAGNLTLVGMPLTPREHTDYYLGYCNSTLWPLFHCFQGRVQIDRSQAEAYQAAQARFAAALRPHLRAGDRIWVHDYQLMPLGRELRRLGWTGRIGFFLHIPFPPYEMWQLLPDPEGLMNALLDYDLIGFQTEVGLDNYRHCARRFLGVEAIGGHLHSGDRLQTAGVYPVGIDPSEFSPAAGPAPRPARGDLTRVVRGRRLILGVDRLDFTKGIPERILAYEDFLRRYPEWRKKVSLVQIASPSRETAPLYVQQKRILDHIIGRVNGEMAEHDWVPIRYLYRSYPRATLARFYRDAAVGLVTPLRDGMNLVAKEFVAAQRPEDPGVLVLSRGAGASDDLPEAIVVNAVIPADVADGIARALAMPIEERIARHRALLDRVRAGSVQAWSARFLEDLDGGTRSFAAGAAAVPIRRGAAGDRRGRAGA